MLLVDEDDQRVRKVQSLLEAIDCAVRIASDASDAERWLRDGGVASLVVLGADSVDCDPIELAVRLRAASQRDALPVLFLTEPDVRPFPFDAAYALGSVDDLCRARLGPVLTTKVRMLLAADDDHSDERTVRELEQRVGALVESSRRTDDFLATLAHELRAPLAPIRNGLELLRLAGDDPAELTTIRGMMARQVDQLTYLVDDLLDVTRFALDRITLKKERVDLRAVLATALETVRPLVDGRGHELTVELLADAFPVNVDPVRMAQVIGNLLSNAVKYTPPGGLIRVTVEVTGSEVLLSIEDSGIGITEEAMPSVFEMFNRVSGSEDLVEGLGVGLALVRRLLVLHDGTVEGSSAGKGQGSTFRIRLPLSSSPATRGRIAAVDRQAPGPGRFRILIVEDNIDGGATMSKVLQHEHHETRLVQNGAAALQIAATFKPEIVLLDIGLPDVSGYDLAPRLRVLDGMDNAVIVAMTGYAGKADRARSRVASIDHHLIKPARLATLRQLLVDVTDRNDQRVDSADDTDVTRAIDGICGVDRKSGFSMLATRAFMQDCIDSRPVAMAIADARLPDCPLFIINRAFSDLTGYPEGDIIGSNCRFLQGRNRDQEGVRLLAAAIREGRDIEVFLHNVTRVGKPFINLLRLYMLRDASNAVRFILGSQLEASVQLTAEPPALIGGANTALDTGVDDYPASLPDRYRSFYAAEASIADEAAFKLRAHVSSLR